VPAPTTSEVEITIEKLKRHKSPDTDQIPEKFIKVGVRIINSEIHNLINSILNEEELFEQCK
jgi:hypothetical protein